MKWLILLVVLVILYFLYQKSQETYAYPDEYLVKKYDLWGGDWGIGTSWASRDDPQVIVPH